MSEDPSLKDVIDHCEAVVSGGERDPSMRLGETNLAEFVLRMLKPDHPLTWDELYIRMVRLVASKSRDTSTKCGCVIVGPNYEVRSTGYNGLPRNVEYTHARTEVRPDKYAYFEHGERNAIYNAARMGTSLDNCIAYVTGPPCADCARGLIQSGIKSVRIPADHSNCAVRNKDRWGDSCARAQEMFEEAGVEFLEVEGT